MNKTQFDKFFRAEIMPAIREYEKPYTRKDRILRTEEYNNLVDAYVRERILPSRAVNWRIPADLIR